MKILVSTGGDITQCSALPTVDPSNLVGYKFVKEYDGTPQRAIVKEHLEEEGKFIVEFLNGGEELINYNDLINIYNAKDEDGTALWSFDKILDHRQTKKGKWEVKILWDTGEETWEPMQTVHQDDKLTLAAYARDNKLTDIQGWKWARWLTKNPTKFIRMARIFAAQMRNNRTRYKYGIKVPRNYKEAVQFDKENGNTLWQDAIKKEMNQILDFRTFKALPKGEKHPKDYTYVPVHLCFDVKFDLRCKARLVAGGNWTDTPDEDAFAGVVSLDAVRTAFFIADLNDLECMTADIGNAYLHGQTKEKIYTIAGPEFGELEGQCPDLHQITLWSQNIHG